MEIGLSRREFIAAAAASFVTPAMAHTRTKPASLFALMNGAPDASAGSSGAWRDAGVADFSKSPHAR